MCQIGNQGVGENQDRLQCRCPLPTAHCESVVGESQFKKVREQLVVLGNEAPISMKDFIIALLQRRLLLHSKTNSEVVAASVASADTPKSEIIFTDCEV